MSDRYKNIKLIVTDIDGTLLKNDGTIGIRTRRAFEGARRAGIHTAIATGRPFDALPKDILDMSCFEYVISCNGTNIYRMSDKTRVYDCKMSPQLVASVAAIFKQYEYPIEVLVGGKSFVTQAYYENPLMLDLPHRMVDYVQSTRHPHADIYHFIDEHITEIESLNMVIDDQEVKYEIRQRLKQLPDIYVTSSVAHYIECNDYWACKGNTILMLGKILGIGPEQIMAFGDSENDLDMLKVAGIGVAMANASEEVIQAADMITLSNEDEGIAELIYQLPGFEPDLYTYETKDSVVF